MPPTYGRFASPLGELLILASERAVTGVWFPTSRHPTPETKAQGREDDGSHPVLARVRGQLTAYFGGTLKTFDLPLEPSGTSFERQVWDLLRTIPYGATTSYGDLARRLGDPKASRAVGAANGKNPIPIIVPCHRVVGANGDLTGFGGGLDRKRWLLEHENAQKALF